MFPSLDNKIKYDFQIIEYAKQFMKTTKLTNIYYI